MKILLRSYFVFALVLGLVPLADLLRAPARPGFAAAVILLLLGVGFLAVLAVRSVIHPLWLGGLIQRLDARLLVPGETFWACLLLLGAALLLGYGTLFTHFFLPPALRSVFIWGAAVILLALLVLVTRYRSRVFWPGFWLPLADLPDAARLDRRQLRVRRWLIAAGVVVFLLLAVPNALGPDSLAAAPPDSDEYLPAYPSVTGMLSPASSPESAVIRFFDHPDAPYGYPFYIFSVLALIPMRLAGGPAFAEFVQFNLLFLRQFISVLPVLAAVAVLAYMQSRFHARFQALGIFAVLMITPAVVDFNVQNWRPEGLVLLLVVLVLFLLEKDALRCGINFSAAAVLAGIAAAVQVYGLLLIPLAAGYLLVGLLKRAVTPRQAGLSFFRFVVLLAVTLLLANPFLFVPNARQTALDAMRQMVDFSVPQPIPGAALSASNPGLPAHLRHLETGFGSLAFLLFLLVSLTAASIWGERPAAQRLVLGWFVILSAYLMFLAPAPPGHAWMIAVVPLASGIFTLVNFVKRVPARRLRTALMIGLTLILLVQIISQAAFTGLELAQSLPGG